jgi:hypothetical protein
MRVDQRGVWLLIAVCCAGVIPLALRAELRHGFYARHRSWHDAPLDFAAACAGAVLTGTALGMALAFAALALAAIGERVAP